MIMFRQPKENQKIEKKPVQTLIGSSVKLEGDFQSRENVAIFGQVNGKIKTEKNIEMGENALVKGDLEGENIVVSGRVEGNILAKEKLDVKNSGKIYGDIKTKTLSISDGAIFCGQCQMEERGSTAERQIPNKSK